MSDARVDFTRGAAERIAKVVRIVETGERDGAPLEFSHALESGGKAFRLGTFTGEWQLNQYKTVTFHNVTSTPNTASVINLCNPSVGFSTANTSESRFVIFGRVKYTTDFVAVEIQQVGTQCSSSLTLGSVDLSTLPGFDSGVIQILGHGTVGTASTCRPVLQWYSITTCGTATASP
jgi:hypothetical protein